jgi:hypothetical protein
MPHHNQWSNQTGLLSWKQGWWRMWWPLQRYCEMKPATIVPVAKAVVSMSKDSAPGYPGKNLDLKLMGFPTLPRVSLAVALFWKQCQGLLWRLFGYNWRREHVGRDSLVTNSRWDWLLYDIRDVTKNKIWELNEQDMRTEWTRYIWNYRKVRLRFQDKLTFHSKSMILLI